MPGNALVPVKQGTQVANYEALEDKARAFAANALSKRTRREYEKCWGKFADWCDLNGHQAIPVSPATLVYYFTEMASGQISNSRIQTCMSAIKNKHKTLGLKIDLENPALVQLMGGIRRTLGQSAKSNRKHPVTADDLRDMILACRADNLREARDAAVLAVGFGACRRRSEVVSLDYEQRNPDDEDSKGVLSLDETKGVIIRLSVSKTNQGGTLEEYIIPRAYARLLYDVIKHWIEMAEIKKGEPVFRSLNTGGCGYADGPMSGYQGITWHPKAGKWRVASLSNKHLGLTDTIEQAVALYAKETGNPPRSGKKPRDLLAGRLWGTQVAEIIKKHYKRLKLKQTGKKKLRPEEEARINDMVAKISGHSLRIGHITQAAENGVPTHQIQLSSGHKTPGMISEYTRVTDKLNKSSLKGMGL